MVSLDSSFLIDLFAGVSGAVEKGPELDASGEPRYPTASEVLFGAHRLEGASAERTRLLVEGLPLLPFELVPCNEAGRLGALLAAEGTPIGQSDLYIGAITRRHGQRLLTRDRSFRRIPGLLTEGY